MSLQPGARLGPYEILAPLGSGGMGEVYRARDSRLGRDVALKILPDALVGNAENLQRFEQEARTASSLNHPHIVTIHEIGHIGDVHFIAQELVEGQTLRQRLSAGRLPIAETLEMAIQIAGALDAAHAAGVVHRDIKPENVMQRPDGYVKVLDFGLAKLTQASGGADADTALNVQTKVGVVMGTVRYMSPEQARGVAVDVRSDLFSLGVVLYEMIAGRPPFEGKTTTDALVAILHVEPAPLRELAPDVPEELQRIVSKSLRKNPEERYQGARDLLVDLKALRSGASSSASASVHPVTRRTPAKAIAAALILAAVLGAVWFLVRDRFIGGATVLTDKDTILIADFTNTTGEAVFDGRTLKQGLALQLGQTPFLNIFPEEGVRTTLALMERQPDERITGAVAREVCVRNGLKVFVSGSIARLGQHFAITIEAVDAQSGSTVAISQGEASDFEHVLQVLSTTATDLRQKLGETIGTLKTYNVRLDEGTTSSLEALKLASAGEAFIERENGAAAVPFFKRAVELDPDFVYAYDGLAWAYASSGAPGAAAAATEGYRRRARASQWEQLSVTATYHHFATGNWEEENRAYDVWIRQFPNQYAPYAGHAINDPVLGQLERAEEATRTLLRAAPTVAQGYRFRAAALLPLQRLDEAQQMIDQGRARGLDNVFLRVTQFGIAFAQNDAAKIQQALAAIRKNEGERSEAGWLARIAAFEGRWRDAARLYQQSQPEDPRATAPPPLPVEALGFQSVLGVCRAEDSARALTISRLAAASGVYTPIVAADGSLCGNPEDADRFADEIVKRFPASTVAREISLPQLRAAAALKRNQPERAVEILQSYRAIGPCTSGVCTSDSFRAFFMKGQAYLRMGKGAEAVAAFQTILDHRGWAPTSPFYALAYAGRARGFAMTGNVAGARQSFEEMFAIWNNADADLPALVAARKDYAALSTGR